MLAGRYSRRRACRPPSRRPRHGPLVLWASQTGNAEEFAARVAALAVRLTAGQHGRRAAWPSWPHARDVLVITSTFGDGGPPDNGADFWEPPRVGRMRPALNGVRYAVLGIGDRSYDNFCGHAKSIDDQAGRRWARRRLLDRTECEVYDDEPMGRWADEVTATRRRSRGELAVERSRRRCDDHRQADQASPSRSPAPSRCSRRCRDQRRADRADVGEKRCASSALTSPSARSV